ncbi:DUF488 family protein [Acetobacter conturbans]|uniref:Uncharacterized protein n=1 Tax=Acetobacter conturbans TaxID=1737472 RepID=A0ABX0JWG1_9PROT|nr:hypothetical protein [Acetobacter conturbans]NHN87315.1 hypothetical protein [Acetobacter conturbans]
MSKKKSGPHGIVKDTIPSTGLPLWSGHDPGKWNGLRDRYYPELDHNGTPVNELLSA